MSERFGYWGLTHKTAATKVKANLIRVSEVAQLMVIIRRNPKAYIDLVKMLQEAKRKVDALNLLGDRPDDELESWRKASKDPEVQRAFDELWRSRK